MTDVPSASEAGVAPEKAPALAEPEAKTQSERIPSGLPALFRDWLRTDARMPGLQ
jgi:hypothetical protein